MSMEEVVDSVRRIVARWTATKAPLVSDAPAGSTVINVNTTKRFREGDEVVIRNSQYSETLIYIKSIVDTTHLELSAPTKYNWTVYDNAIVQKTFYQHFMQHIYIGEPENIPRFPAITITPVTRESEWLTIDSTRETYNLKLTIFVKDDNQEDTFRYLLKVTDIIQRGLKNNIFPLVGPYQTASLAADANAGDISIKVSDTSIFTVPAKHRIIIEDLYKAEENRIESIEDSNTLRLTDPLVACYKVQDSAKIINVTRFIYNSWPSSIDYGTIFKGTMLKAATIQWFAWEEEVQPEMPLDTNLT